MLTVETLQHRLDWQGVDETVNAEYHLVYLFVRPTNPDLEPVYICLDEQRSSIIQFGFGEWHCHPDQLEDAIEKASLLVHGKRCIVEECDATGEYLGGGLYGPHELPETLGRKAKSLRRLFFNRVPICETIDFSRYFRGRHIWVSHDRKAETERVYRELGMPGPEW